jgi:poly(A) polymerase
MNHKRDSVIDSTSVDQFELLESIRSIIPADKTIYLVGGAVRDRLVGRTTHDLDFVLTGDVLGLGRRIANALGGAYFPLDQARDTARVILMDPDEERQVLDFAAIRGPDLESDLRKRDFTINAMAVNLDDPQTLLDPLGGSTDLRRGELRACSDSAFMDDAVRILRAVRQAIEFELKILPETRQQMMQARARLEKVSSERIRDELFRILSAQQPATALRILDLVGALEYILPELSPLKGVEQPAPHIYDVWEHTLSVVQNLEKILNVLALDYDPETASSLALGLISLKLGRYRKQIHAHLGTEFTPDRSLRPALFFAALYHDVKKPATRSIQEDNRIRFLKHDELGAQTVMQRARDLHLSNPEIERLKTIVRHHMRPLLLSQLDRPPTRRAVYRYFRDTGPAGVDICLLSLADSLGTYGATLPHDRWEHQLDVVRNLLSAWWEQPQEKVFPPALVNGHDLMQALKLEPGPKIGELLEAIREAQVTGQAKTREQALEFARQHLKQQGIQEDF